MINRIDCHTGSREWFIAMTYLVAKDYVLKHSPGDVIYHNQIDFEKVDERFFLQEAAWVVLNSGMKESIIRSIFPKISNGFYNWESANIILENADECIKNSLQFFNNLPKLNAIISISQFVAINGFDNVKSLIIRDGTHSLRLPYIGPVTSFHLAKNIGLDVAKPDRHLVRIAKQSGYDCVHKFCADIGTMIGDNTSIVDTVLWRFATLIPDYEDFFSIP